MSESLPPLSRRVERDARPNITTDAAFLIEDLQALVAFVDRDQRFCYVNHAFASFFERSREALLGKTLRETIGIEHHSIAEPYINEVLTGGRPVFLSSLRHSDGTFREMRVTYTPHRNESGDVDEFCALMEDLTEQNVEQEARARLAAIVESSDDAIVSKTLDGVITSWNRGAEEIFGYTASEAIGQHISLIIPGDRRDEENQVLSRLRRGEKIDHFETERRAKDGSTVVISLTVSPVRNASGALIGASKVARNITGQKRAAEQLRSSEHYRNAMLESMPECVTLFERDGTVLHVNPAGLRMFEAIEPEQVVGKCIYSLIQVEDVEAFRSVIQSAFEGTSGARLEFGLRGLKGSERNCETNVVPLRTGVEGVIGALAIILDVSERRKGPCQSFCVNSILIGSLRSGL